MAAGGGLEAWRLGQRYLSHRSRQLYAILFNPSSQPNLGQKEGPSVLKGRWDQSQCRRERWTGAVWIHWRSL
ncbi:hypothetical protein E2562_006759, partial [Oryza meyeriana var. granulata]